MILQISSDARYVEHGNLNSYRSYPFSETESLQDSDGVPLQDDIFVDAMMYPIVLTDGDVHLDSLDCSVDPPVAEAHCGGIALQGAYEASMGTIEFKDPRGRHAGSLVCGPGWPREMASRRKRMFAGLRFAPTACRPVVHDGVEGLVLPVGEETSRKNIVLTGSNGLEPVIRDTPTGKVLRIDAHAPETEASSPVVRGLLFTVFGRAAFSLAMADPNDESTVLLAGSGFDREDVCWQAHQEDAVSTVVDTCEEPVESCHTPELPLPDPLPLEVCSTESGAIYLVSDDLANQRNPFKISLVHGDEISSHPQISADMSTLDMFTEAGKLLGRQPIGGNAIKIEITGLGNGR